MTQVKAVALDAMGVIYTMGDDLREWLIPYLRTRSCSLTDDEIVQLYRRCYREGAPAAELWQATGCDWDGGRLEDEFIAGYELVPGVIEFLQSMKQQGVPIFCVSNDVAEWSAKKRARFGLEGYFTASVISGEMRVAKPAAEIFAALAKLLPCSPAECLFVDDRDYNVKGGIAAGYAGVIFDAPATDDVPAVSGFGELLALIESRNR